MMIYLLKSTLAMAFFLGLYQVFLRKEKMLRFNRFYLLLAMAAALCMPLWVSSTHYIASSSSPEISQQLSDTIIAHPASSVDSAHHFSYAFWLWAAYGLGLAIMMARFLFQCSKVFKLLLGGEQIPQNGYKLILHDQIQLPFTFLHYIFLNKQSYLKREIEPMLIQHERAHVLQAHSIDILLSELIHCVFWFNPILILFKKAIRLNHEFLADEAVIATKNTPEAYMHLLLQKAGNYSPMPLTSSLTYGETKKRLNMMFTQSNKTQKLIKQSLIFPIFLASFFILGQSKTLYQESDTSTEPFSSTAVTDQTQDFDSEFMYDLKLDDGGMMVYIQLEGKKKSRRVFSWLSGGNQVSFINEAGVETIKLCKELTDEERSWFWKLDKSRAKQFKRAPAAKRPTEAQMKEFLDPKIYGVWLDGVRVKNSALLKYAASDIHRMYKSGLERNAAHYGQYNYHLNLYTQAAFDREYAGKKEGWWEPIQLKAGGTYRKLNDG